MFIVIGGVYEDTSFTKVKPGTQERYGPFSSYKEALNVWRGKCGWNVDNCYHRLFINEYPRIA